MVTFKATSSPLTPTTTITIITIIDPDAEALIREDSLVEARTAHRQSQEVPFRLSNTVGRVD